MNPFMTLIIAFITLGLGLVIGYIIKHYQVRAAITKGQVESEKIIEKAKEEALKLELQAQNNALVIRETAEKEIVRRRAEIAKEEDRLQHRREDLDIRADRIEHRQLEQNKRQSALDRRVNELEKKYTEQIEELQRISQMSLEEARKELLTVVEKDSRDDMARIIRQIETEAREDGEKRARKIIAEAIQRVASEHVAEVTTNTVTLPSEEMKGRIIGRNGRNIQAFEQAAGVDVIVDDTPEAVTISCFDSVRREIGRRALEKLIIDGRIHPAYIEKVLREEKKEV
ncbi:MAG: Rnase Y domain-containing protein, partial [Anaerolineales bacterium]|nr:Rnase Y domain-containing protein [Anaerolineales bacterium]